MNSEYEIVVCTGTTIVIVDLDVGKSLTNNASNVIRRLDDSLPGGIGKRKVFYRDRDKRYDEMVVSGGRFVRFAPCTEGQQQSLKQFVLLSAQAVVEQAVRDFAYEQATDAEKITIKGDDFQLMAEPV